VLRDGTERESPVDTFALFGGFGGRQRLVAVLTDDCDAGGGTVVDERVRHFDDAPGSHQSVVLARQLGRRHRTRPMNRRADCSPWRRRRRLQQCRRPVQSPQL